MPDDPRVEAVARALAGKMWNDADSALFYDRARAALAAADAVDPRDDRIRVMGEVMAAHQGQVGRYREALESALAVLNEPAPAPFSSSRVIPPREVRADRIIREALGGDSDE